MLHSVATLKRWLIFDFCIFFMVVKRSFGRYNTTEQVYLSLCVLSDKRAIHVGKNQIFRHDTIAWASGVHGHGREIGNSKYSCALDKIIFIINHSLEVLGYPKDQGSKHKSDDVEVLTIRYLVALTQLKQKKTIWIKSELYNWESKCLITMLSSIVTHKILLQRRIFIVFISLFSVRLISLLLSLRQKQKQYIVIENSGWTKSEVHTTNWLLLSVIHSHSEYRIQIDI